MEMESAAIAEAAAEGGVAGRIGSSAGSAGRRGSGSGSTGGGGSAAGSEDPLDDCDEGNLQRSSVLNA